MKRIVKARLQASSLVGRSSAGRNSIDCLLRVLHMAAGQGAGAGWNIEAEVAAALRLVPNENAFVIDAGANTGVWSGLFLQKHRSAHILAVEPLPVAAEQIRARKLAGLDVIQAALSSNCGKSALFLEHPLDVAASLTKRRDSLFVNRRYSQIEVETLTLDSLIPPGQAVHFLKMDLEGQELEVIQGAAQCFENQMIHTLQFEFGSANINSRSCFLDFWNALTPNGYAIFRIMPGGGLWPIPAYTEDLEYYRGATNYIATIRARQ